MPKRKATVILASASKRSRSGRARGRLFALSNFDSKDNSRIMRTKLSVPGAIATALGVITTVIENSDVTTSVDWSSYDALYDEFRIIAHEIKIYCKVPNDPIATAICDQVVMVYDDDDTTALTSFGNGTSYTNHSLFPAVWSSGRAIRRVFRRPVSGHLTSVPWHDMASGGTYPGSIKFYAAGLNAGATTYLTYTSTYYVEFRGRR